MRTFEAFAGAALLSLGLHGAMVAFAPAPGNGLPPGDGFGIPAPELSGNFEDLAETTEAPDPAETLEAEAPEEAAPEEQVEAAEPLEPEVTNAEEPQLPEDTPEPVETAEPEAPEEVRPQPIEDAVEVAAPVAQALMPTEAAPIEALPAVPVAAALTPEAEAPVAVEEMAEAIEEEKPFTITSGNANSNTRETLDEPFKIDLTTDLLALQSLTDDAAELPEFASALNRPKPRATRNTSRQQPRSTARSSNRSSSAGNRPRAGGRSQGNRGGGGTGRADNSAIRAFEAAVNRKIGRSMRRVRGVGSAVVVFRINARGGLASVSISRSSGNGALDREIVRAVRRAAPFPVPPRGANTGMSLRLSSS